MEFFIMGCNRAVHFCSPFKGGSPLVSNCHTEMSYTAVQYMNRTKLKFCSPETDDPSDESNSRIPCCFVLIELNAITRLPGKSTAYPYRMNVHIMFLSIATSVSNQKENSRYVCMCIDML